MRTRQRRTARTAGALLGVAVLVAAGGCVNGAISGGSQPSASAIHEVRFYGTDGNMLNSIGERLTGFPDGLVGMKGTAPLTRLSHTFIERLKTVDPELKDDQYAGESYDAVVVASLAAQAAKTTAPQAIASQMVGVTTGHNICTSPAICMNLLNAGKDIAYRGVSLRLSGFTDAGEPSTATYGILHFTNKNQLDPDQTEFVPAGDPGAASTTPPPVPGKPADHGPLKIGALLPHTGALGPAGPPLFAGAQLAVRDINQAGGVLGKPVTWVDGDDHTDKALALETTKSLIAQGVDVIVGAGASSITAAVLPTVMEAGVVLISPCNTAAALSTVDDHGLYFRTAPPDGLQATALSDIIMRDGVRRLMIVARNDSYGQGLMNSVHDDLVKAGIDDTNIKLVQYDPDQPDFTHLGADVLSFAPDGVLVVGFDESTDAFDAIMKDKVTSRS
jgi:branched-chain amino acid transport system substrate-binding protein